MNNLKKTLLSDKGKKLIIILIAAIGLLLIFLPSFFESSNVSSSDGSYGENLEKKLKSVLESVTGDGTIEVMITFESVYNTNEVQETGLFSSSKAQVTETPSPEISGVMIVCKGISDTGDFDIIKRAAATALGTDQNKIYIIGGARQK